MSTSTSDDSIRLQQSLFERLCPLLIIRLLPLRVFNDLKSSVMYGQLHNPPLVNGIFSSLLMTIEFFPFNPFYGMKIWLTPLHPDVLQK